MLLIHIPAEGAIQQYQHDGDRLIFSLLGPDNLIEEVKFGLPEPHEPVFYVSINPPAIVVMLVDEEGMYKFPVNRRASVLYQGGRHNQKIYGDAYLCMVVHAYTEDAKWVDIGFPYDDPEYWEDAIRQTEYLP